MAKAKRMPIGRAAELLAQPFGLTGGRAWLSDRLREGALVARCATWMVQGNSPLLDVPSEATDFEIPASFWRIDRTRDGEQINDASSDRSISRAVLNSDWSTGRFAEVQTYGGISSTAHVRSTSVIVTGVTIGGAEFDRLTAGMGIDPNSSSAAVGRAATVVSSMTLRMRGKGPTPTYDRERALMRLIALMNHHCRCADSFLGVDALFPQLGDQAKVEQALLTAFAELDEHPNRSTILPTVQAMMREIDGHRSLFGIDHEDSN